MVGPIQELECGTSCVMHAGVAAALSKVKDYFALYVNTYMPVTSLTLESVEKN